MPSEGDANIDMMATISENSEPPSIPPPQQSEQQPGEKSDASPREQDDDNDEDIPVADLVNHDDDVLPSPAAKPKRDQRNRWRRPCSREGCTNMAQRGGVCTRHGAAAVRRTCSQEGCTNVAKRAGVCIRHGARGRTRPCDVEGCTNYAIEGGVCIRHGARVATCSVEGCDKQVINGGLCVGHGATRSSRKLCCQDGCANYVVRGGVCHRHGARRPPCNVEGCEKSARIRGLCYGHGRRDDLPSVDDRDNAKAGSDKSAKRTRGGKAFQCSVEGCMKGAPRGWTTCIQHGPKCARKGCDERATPTWKGFCRKHGLDERRLQRTIQLTASSPIDNVDVDLKNCVDGELAEGAEKGGARAQEALRDGGGERREAQGEDEYVEESAPQGEDKPGPGNGAGTNAPRGEDASTANRAMMRQVMRNAMSNLEMMTAMMDSDPEFGRRALAAVAGSHLDVVQRMTTGNDTTDPEATGVTTSAHAALPGGPEERRGGEAPGRVFRDRLRNLEGLGFTDRLANVQALASSRGDEAGAIQILLKNIPDEEDQEKEKAWTDSMSWTAEDEERLAELQERKKLAETRKRDREASPEKMPGDVQVKMRKSPDEANGKSV